MCYDDGFESCDPYDGDDLAAWSDNEAWEDAQADMREMSAEETLTATLRLPAETVVWANEVLQRIAPVDGYKSDATLEAWTARFPDGMEVDVKVVNGSGPWLDVILFDQDGAEVQIMEHGYGSLDGEYHFSGYILVIEAEVQECVGHA